MRRRTGWLRRPRDGARHVDRRAGCDRICHTTGRCSGLIQEVAMEVFTHLGAWQALTLVACAALAAGIALGFAAGRSGAGRAREAFKALAADALRDNTDTFLAIAGERFQRFEESSETDWDAR